MIPIVDGLEERYQGQVAVLQLNAAESANSQLQSNLGLTGHPSFAIIDRDGLVIQRFYGPQAQNILSEAMESLLSN